MILCVTQPSGVYDTCTCTFKACILVDELNFKTILKVCSICMLVSCRSFMSAARFGMQRSLPFIPRSVSRKPHAGNRTVASTGAEATKGVAETPSGTDDNASTSAVSQKELDNVSVAHQSKTYASDSLRKSPGKDAGLESDKTLVSSHDCNSESGKSDLGAPVLLSGAVVTDTEITTVKESQSNSTINQSDNVVSSEPPGFSFSKFVESVCKHNNIDIESKENQPSLQTASTSDKVGPSSSDIKQTTETIGFSFQSFVETVYTQSNIPLIDVGALSPRRKVALFTRQNQPHYVPKQPIFDAAAVKETVMDKGRELSIAAGKVSSSFRHATEPASKRFKEAAEMGRRTPGLYIYRNKYILRQVKSVFEILSQVLTH